jgi:gliding motility-associated-like protein
MPQLYARISIIVLCLMTSSIALLAQEINISQGGTVNTCGGTLYDAGGPTGNHTGAGQFQEIILCSDGLTGNGTHIQLTFLEFNITGTLTVFNGTTTAADTLWSNDPTANGNPNVQSFRIPAATDGNASGCVLVRFESTGSSTGWAANINCVVACKPIEAILTTTSPAAEQDGDNTYINICPGDPITFTATGDYPESGGSYDQSDADSYFIWNFQDGTIDTGTTITHVYNDPGGYIVQLTIEDQMGCKNFNNISQRVRVAPPPVFNTPDNLPENVCVDDIRNLTVSRLLGGETIDFNPEPVEFSFNTSQTFSELTFLPDGDGTQYESPLVFTNFNPGQTLNNASDIVRICATMEHSYLGDLDIRIQCPDGTLLNLHSFNSGNAVTGQTLGMGDEATVTPDPPGVYCWTASAPFTMTEVVVNQGIAGNQTMPEINYAPEQSFNTLVGCELNGEWQMVIIDNISRDQGYIYEWTIEFAGSVYPNQETFTVPIAQSIIKDNGLYQSYTPDSVIWNPQNPGPHTVRIITTDDYDCSYDTSVIVNVLPPYDPLCATCGPILDVTVFDTSICQGEAFQANLIDPTAGDTAVTWESVLDADFGHSPYSSITRALENDIVIVNHFPTTITDVTQDLFSVCINLENNGDLGDVTLQIISPNGRTINLIENSGGNGDDLSQTCFTPTSANPLSSGVSPYTGDFMAANGDWADLNGSPINGTWRLRAWDRAGNDVGNLLTWSVNLRYNQNLTYAWTPASPDLSCTNCPNPVFTPTAAGTYTLDVTSAAGCTDQAVVNVDFNALNVDITNAVTPPSCPGGNDGRIDLTLPAGSPAVTFLWENSSTGDTLVGLSAGNYMVTITDPTSCTQVETFIILDRPALTATLDNITDAFCNGGSTGEIFVTTTGGTAPYTYLWDDPNAQVDEDAGALTAGTYNLVVTDAVGCTANLPGVVVQHPDPLMLAFTPYPVACRDGDNGRAVVEVTGGNGGYLYSWDNGGVTDSVFNLLTGTVSVTITDALGCQTSGSVFVPQPAMPLTAMIVQDMRGCFETSTNQATVTPAGGFGSYSYLWSNGEAAATAMALPAGQNTVTVTDGGGCEEVISVTTNDLPELTVSILATAPSCNDTNDGQLGAVPTGGIGLNESDYTYAWSNTGAGIVIVNVPGDVLYQVTVTDGQGCIGVGERFLAKPAPILFSTDETPVDCFGNATGALAISNLSGPNPGGFTFQWGPAAGSSASNVVDNLPAGGYSLRIRDALTCVLDTVLRITEPPVLEPNIDQIDVSCFGETDARITITGTGGVGGYRYNWSTGSIQNQIVSLGAATYTITLSDANDCEAIRNVVITEPSAVGIQISENNAVICEGEATGSITVEGTGGRPPFVYGLENQGFSRNNVFVGLRAGEYIAFVRDSAGCQTTINTMVDDGPEFSIDLGEDQNIVFGDSITLTPTIVGGIDSLFYTWMGSYPGTLSCLDCPDPSAKPEYEIDYTLSILDVNGCFAEDRFRVSVAKIREVAVPSGFSPNNDGQNDVLIVHGRPGTKVSSFAVYDRWSNILFEDGDYAVNDTSRGWDGMHEGKAVNAGVYIYKMVIEYEDGSTETLAGETTLVR